MFKANNKNKNKGFSVLEIAILLVIVVVLAATALPKIQGSLKSHQASIASMAGEFDNAVRLARAQWFSNGQSGAGRIDGFADGQIWSGKRGWPMGHSADAPVSLGANECASVWNGIMRSKGAPEVSTDASSAWQARTGRSGECQYVSQLDNQQRVITYNTNSGKVSYN